MSHMEVFFFFGFIPRRTEFGAPIGCCKGGTYDNEVPASTEMEGKSNGKRSVNFGDSGFLKENKKREGSPEANMSEFLKTTVG